MYICYNHISTLEIAHEINYLRLAVDLSRGSFGDSEVEEKDDCGTIMALFSKALEKAPDVRV